MKSLYVRMPDGTERNFGVEKATLVTSLPPMERDNSVRSFIVTTLVEEVGAGNVGEIPLIHYEIRDSEA